MRRVATVLLLSKGGTVYKDTVTGKHLAVGIE